MGVERIVEVKNAYEKHKDITNSRSAGEKKKEKNFWPLSESLT